MPTYVPDTYRNRPLFLVHHYRGRVPDADRLTSPWAGDRRTWATIEDAVRNLASDAIDEESQVRPCADDFALLNVARLAVESAADAAGWTLPDGWLAWIAAESEAATRERQEARDIRDTQRSLVGAL
jgi:hypothetical protein